MISNDALAAVAAQLSTAVAKNQRSHGEYTTKVAVEGFWTMYDHLLASQGERGLPSFWDVREEPDAGTGDGHEP